LGRADSEEDDDFADDRVDGPAIGRSSMMRIGTGSRAPRTALCLVTTAVVVFGGAVMALAGDAEEALKAGMALLGQGKNKEANEKFRAVLAADPSSQDAYDLVKRTDYRLFLDMLKAGGDAEQVAKRLLALSSAVEIERSKDPEAIKALVDEAVRSKDLDKREAAARKLAGAHGQYAVPGLVGFLGSNDIDVRANAILALTKIGSDAVLPLAASIGTGNDMQKANTVKLLARLGDERSEPAVAKAAGDKAGAAQKYVAMAKKYFDGDPLTVKAFDRSFAIWSVKEGALVYRDVARFVYNYELAEQCAYEALALDPMNKEARALLVLANCGEQVAFENLGDDAKANEAIQAQGKALEGVGAVAGAVGCDGCLDAFQLGADLGNGDAAAKVAESIPAVWDGRAIVESNPLVRGLTSDSSKVRYAAAIALLRINPPASFAKSNMVALTAGEAAASRAVRQVLVIDTDGKNAMNVQRALNHAGFHAVAANAGTDGLSMAKATGGFDAVVVANKLSDISTFQVLADLGRDFRTANAKRIVMAVAGDLGASKGEFEKYGLAGVAPTSTDSVGVVKTVQEALASPEGDAGRKRANALSIAASNAIAGANNTAFNLHDAQKGLLAASGEGADPDVALAALNALSRISTSDAQSSLRAIITNASMSPAHRVAACRAMASAVRGQAVSKETYEALLAAMGDADTGVRTAAGAALGSAALTPEQRADALTKRRVE
jgi:HEAT repeat protein